MATSRSKTISEKDTPLCRRYRYNDEGRRIRLEPLPQVGPQAAMFIHETTRICKGLFGVGASLNSVCGSQYGGLIFQHSRQEVNRFRAREVTKLWRKAKRDGIIK